MFQKEIIVTANQLSINSMNKISEQEILLKTTILKYNIKSVLGIC